MKAYQRIKSAMSAWRGERRARAFGGVFDASRLDEGWSTMPWQSLDSRQEFTSYDYEILWRRARMLYHNCPPIRKAVKEMGALTGYLTPLPRTLDDEWNELAAAAFTARTSNPLLFDVAGRLNFRQAQMWIERWAIIDGDNATVMSIASDGGSAFAFFKAPQIRGEAPAICGVELSRGNRATAYHLYDYGRDMSQRVPASAVLHYQHDPDACGVRGVTELIAAIRHGNDIRETNGYTKQAIKLAASFGLVETSQANDPYAGVGSQLGGGKKKNGEAPATSPVEVMGIKIARMLPGRKLEPITDNRPSQQVRAFIKDLIADIAYSVGLDPAILYDASTLGSAGVRFDLEKLKAWQAPRLLDLQAWCQRVYVYTLAREIAAGRLRACKDPNWQNVTWIPRRDLTIDIAREGGMKINLCREGLADMDAFVLATEGKPFAHIITSRARNMALAKKAAEDNGLTLAEVMPGSIGSTNPPTPQPIPDDEPEQVFQAPEQPEP